MPAERFQQFGVILLGDQLVYQPGDNIAGQSLAGGSVEVLLPLEPGTLEKRLIGQMVRG